MTQWDWFSSGKRVIRFFSFDTVVTRVGNDRLGKCLIDRGEVKEEEVWIRLGEWKTLVNTPKEYCLRNQESLLNMRGLKTLVNTPKKKNWFVNQECWFNVRGLLFHLREEENLLKLGGWGLWKWMQVV